MRLRSRQWWQIFGLGVLLLAIVVVVFNIDVVQLLFPRAGGVPANIVVDTQGVLGTLPTPWKNLAQGGEEARRMLQDVVPQMRALEPEYVRIDHVYDFYQVVGRDESGALTFDWSRLDPVVSDILAAGATPFLSLSYMPAVLSSGDTVAPPKDYSEWSVVVSRTVSHFSGTGGRNIPNVYYEVWNEPDLFGGWRTYGDRNYISLYAAAVSGAEGVSKVQPFKIGGPATTGLYKNWFDKLLEYTSQNNIRLDFFSWHRYSTDPGVFWQDVEDARAWAQAFPQRQLDLEFIVSEWGHNSENDGGYDGMYGAAHTMAVAMEMVNRIDRGFVFEVQDGADPSGKQFWGRWGLLTHENQGVVAKPRYQALNWLNTVPDNRLSLTGKGTWVKAMAGEKGGEVQVLLVNFDPRAQHTETVPVTFTNLQEQQFEVTEAFLRGQTKVTAVATTAAELRYDVFMPVNSMVRLVLSPSP
ncbi:MAG: hypothetical protein HYS86_00820 [Candidatus Chisholmbacteria bacterium]|nr:hypothetical protein [Candidatus Chisholmbacteria bacterium]